MLASGVFAGSIESILSNSVEFAVVSVVQVSSATSDVYDSKKFINVIPVSAPLKNVTHISATCVYFYSYFTPFPTRSLLSMLSTIPYNLDVLKPRCCLTTRASSNVLALTYCVTRIPEFCIDHTDVHGRITQIKQIDTSLHKIKIELLKKAR